MLDVESTGGLKTIVKGSYLDTALLDVESTDGLKTIVNGSYLDTALLDVESTGGLKTISIQNDKFPWGILLPILINHTSITDS